MPATEHSAPQPDTVSLDELRDMFTGVPCEPSLVDGDEWATTPSYTVGLAFEICRRTDTVSDYQLRTLLYDTTAAEHIPGPAQDVIRLAAARYRMWRELSQNPKGRGL